ncbi:hypothetical protein F4810DRAFT_710847 [Camillea tinctor]|nr:hypothetical protein F4810DRAFT_710847 [Camillea tinctor]
MARLEGNILIPRYPTMIAQPAVRAVNFAWIWAFSLFVTILLFIGMWAVFINITGNMRMSLEVLIYGQLSK